MGRATPIATMANFKHRHSHSKIDPPKLPYIHIYSDIQMFRLTREFFTHMETSPLHVKGCKSGLYSALMAIEHLRVLVRVTATVIRGIRGPVTVTTECLAVEL